MHVPFKYLEPHVVGIFFVVRLSFTAYDNPSTAPNDLPAWHIAYATVRAKTGCSSHFRFCHFNVS